MSIVTPSASAFPATAELVVIGGGIVGAATAFFAARAGLRPLVLERRAALATLTTPRSLEAVRAQFEDPDDVAMMRESLELFERFAEVVGPPGYDIGLRQQGYLFLTQAADGPQRVRRRVEAQRAFGLPDVELLEADEALRRFPFLARDVTAAAFRARDGWLASHETTYGFAAASSARVFVETEVIGFEVRAGRLEGVLTNRGRVLTRAAVIACGPFSGRVAALAGVALPLRPVRRHRAGIREHALVPREAPMTVSLDTGAHWRPEGPGAYLGFSSALEEPPDEPREDVPADWTFPALALEAAARFTPFWGEVARTLVRSNVTLQAGQYDLTPDAKPLLGPCGAVEGLYLNTGYSGHGVMGSPGGARRVVDTLTGRLREEDNPFALSRFARPGGVRARRPL